MDQEIDNGYGHQQVNGEEEDGDKTEMYLSQ